MNYFEQESNRLIYRRLANNDVPSWEEFFDGNDRLHFLGLDVTKPHSELAKEWIERQFQRYEEDGFGLLAVIEKLSGDFIGMCGILKRELDLKPEYEIGYSFKSKYWKKGYATEAANQMRNFGQHSMLANRFISIIHIDNLDSMAVARKNEMAELFETEFLGMPVIIFGTKMV